MRLLIAAVVLVVAPLVFADDATWLPSAPTDLHVTSITPGRSETAKERVGPDDPVEPKSQDSGKASNGGPPADTQQDAQSNQHAGKQSDGVIDPDKRGGEWWDWQGALKWFFFAGIGLCLTGAGLFVAVRNVQISREVNSPQVSLGEWGIVHPPGKLAYVTCKVTNNGNTPAVVIESMIGSHIDGEGLSSPVYEELVDKTGRTMIAAKGCIFLMTQVPLNAKVWPLVQDGRIAFSVLASVIYRGKWKPRTGIQSSALYDYEMETFRTISSNRLIDE